MPWQDIVITICQIVACIALFPSILSKDKPAIASSIMNFSLLIVMSYTNFTLGLYGAAVGILLVAIEWAILAIQKYRIDRKVKS